MLRVEQLVSQLKRAPSRPADAELKALPFKKAYIYGRQSNPSQIRNHTEALLELSVLVDLAKADGFQSKTTADQIREWLLDIQRGAIARGVIEDGEVTVDVSDLGLSGRLNASERGGLANLKEKILVGEVGCVYVTEGPNRLSRAPDRIEQFELLKIMKDHLVRLRTPEDVYNPAIERDWDYIADEFEAASKESRTQRRRLYRRKKQKAARGEWVSGGVPPGFFLPIAKQDTSTGKYTFGKLDVYPPHAEVSTKALQVLYDCDGSWMKAVRQLKGVVYPFFEQGLQYMESRSSLSRCPQTPAGYRITTGVLKGLARNMKMIGVWQYSDCDPIVNNHPAPVPIELWLKVYDLVTKKDKPKGRTVNHPPQEWEGLLYCHNHDDPVRLSSCRSSGDYRCKKDYEAGHGSMCMVVTAETLEKPLMNEVFRQLDFTPYAEEVLARLEMEGSSSKEDLNRWKRELKELERVQDSLLSALRLAKNEAVRQRIVDDMEEAQARLDSMRANPPAVKTIRPDDFGVVRDFLADFEDKWQRLSRQRRNRLLKLLIDRVELTPKKTEIDAAVIWKTGVQQQLTIERPGAVRNRDHVWTSHDKQLLTTLWPSADPETITQAFPNRTWQALACQAHRLGLKRRTKYERKDSLSRWTPEELDQTRQKYEGGIPVSEIAQSIGRSEDAVLKKATKNKWYRPREAKWPKAKPNWQTSHFSRLQESPCHTSA